MRGRYNSNSGRVLCQHPRPGYGYVDITPIDGGGGYLAVKPLSRLFRPVHSSSMLYTPFVNTMCSPHRFTAWVHPLRSIHHHSCFHPCTLYTMPKLCYVFLLFHTPNTSNLYPLAFPDSFCWTCCSLHVLLRNLLRHQATNVCYRHLDPLETSESCLPTASFISIILLPTRNLSGPVLNRKTCHEMHAHTAREAL